MDVKLNIYLVCYICRYDILSQQIRKIQDYHKKLIVISMLPSTAEKQFFFCHTKLQTIIIKVVFSKFLYLIANWTSYQKPIKEALTILKSPVKLLITSSYNGQQLVFLDNQIYFL